MSILQYPDPISTQNMQIWDNAAFDGITDESAIKPSWVPLQPIIFNGSEGIESESSKENRSPVGYKSPITAKSPTPIKPKNSQGKPLKLLFKQGLLNPSSTLSDSDNSEKIDIEIGEIEKEISRLSSRLEELRIEKEGRESKSVGRIVPAKFMEQKQSTKTTSDQKKIRESPAKFRQRSVSMGPEEIAAGVRSRQESKQEMTPLQSMQSNRKSWKLPEIEEEEEEKERKKKKKSPESAKFQRRGVSMGPSEISAGVRFRRESKQEITPLPSIQSRRKSCFWKLPEIEEEKIKKERRRRSVSPKSRPSVVKISDPKRGFSTVGSKKPIKRDAVLLTSVQPKKLFKDGEKTVKTPGLKKPLKNARIVPSRYSQIPAPAAVQSPEKERRKRSLPENEREVSKREEKKRSSSVGKSRVFLSGSDRNPVPENRVKRSWEVPIEANDSNSSEDTPSAILEMAELLPKIRTVRWTINSPRDSGCAKRVADLIGKRSCFSGEESEAATSVCHALGFEQEEE
ncbi:uncharacterized protein LOC143882515 [Tasmannia lanceolata]|uniref:uncharacterized protein LOC143882515 n=1 Tax=Tasmannia lanceolata TaxID=3420 RepID=UPI0040643764